MNYIAAFYQDSENKGKKAHKEEWIKFEEIKNTLKDLSRNPNINLLLAHSGGVDSSVLANLLLSKKIKKLSIQTIKNDFIRLKN